MTGNSKKRGRPPKATTGVEKNKFQFHLLKKPKYLLNKTSDSQISTPHTSRASSPQSSDRSRTSARTKYLSRSKSKKKNDTPKATNKKGYSYHNKTDYIYGSDFEDTSDNEISNSYSSDSAESDNDNGDSDSDFSMSSYSSLNLNKTSQETSPCSTPEPIWLQAVDVPTLEIPETSDDLLIPQEFVLWSCSIYEVLRRFHSIVRLSPFRLEDFCAALVCDEQSVLLSEIHIQLLKAILREEDSQQTHFGPLDQKDSVNITLYLIDNVTWPEVLRSYVESSEFFDRNILKILSECEYPYTSIEQRLTVLQFLSDQFLNSTIVRDDMLREGPIHYDDHCRVCHRLGDLLCCETCPAVFHLECVDPPLANVPTEDWQCGLCKSHKVSGVSDCILPIEKQGGLCRHDILGYDRHGRKYWFMCRRIFVESLDGEKMWYYTVTKQFQLLLENLDKEDMETKLYKNLTAMQDLIEHQMKLTEDLTLKNKGPKKSQIEVILENISGPVGQTPMEICPSEDELNSTSTSTVDDKSITDDANEKSIQTRSKTGSLLPRTFVVDDLRRKSYATNSITKKEDQERTIEELSQIFKSPFFKLGMEGSFKTYVNQYNTNVIALNKPQRNEERDKKRHLSHKFSLTDASLFKWSGNMNGTAPNVLLNLKSTLIAFEQLIAPQFLHPNWTKIKKMWANAVNAASNYNDIAQVLEVFQIFLKQVVFLNVWHEQLGHMNLLRITSMEREERKKQEKREKRERDDEEERYRMSYSFVKYSLGLKHQVWKQKGEEYRLHGQLGWLWIASSRKQHVQLPQVFISRKEVVCIKIDGNYFSLALDTDTKVYLTSLLSSSNNQLSKILQTTANIELVEMPKELEYLNISKALLDSNRIYFTKVGPKCKLNNILTKRELLKQNEEIDTSADKKAVSDASKKRPSPEILEQILTSICKSSRNEGKSYGNYKKKNIVKEIQMVKNKYTQHQRFSKQYVCYSQRCKASDEKNCYSPLCIQRLKLKNELLGLLKLSQVDGTVPKEILQILSNVRKDGIADLEMDSNGIEPYNHKNLNENLTLAFAEKIPIKLDDIKLSLTTKDESEIALPVPEVKTEKDTESKVDDVKQEAETDDKKMDCDQVKPNPPNSVLEDAPQFLAFKSPRTTRGRPPKTAKPIVQEQVHCVAPAVRVNRRFPKIPAPTKQQIKEEDYGKFEDGRKRYYSTTNTRLKINLSSRVKDATAEDYQLLYPVPPTFLTYKGNKTLLVLPTHELQRLARTGGSRFIPSGFNFMAKNNSSVWPYPCPRPLFKTCWLYRTLSLKSLSGVALQLRILWHCLRWDDMQVKPANLDGKHQITTETEIVSLELLKHRNVGKYMDVTQYLRRKVVIPLELPKTVRSEITSTRLGLRKRKRAESPQKTEPQVTEEWIDEDKLELWEVKLYGEKQERLKMQPITRTATGKLNPIQKYDPSVPKPVLKTTPDESKLRTELGSKSQVMSQSKQILDEDAIKKHQIINKNVVQRKLVIKSSNGNQKVITQAAPTPPKVESQKVQVIRGPDGKISVRGLNPGQQLIQTSDGKLHVVNTNPRPAAGQPAVKPNAPKTVTQTVVQKMPVASSQALNVPQTNTIQKKIVAPNLTQLLQPANTKLVLAQPGQSQSKIVLNPTVVQSGGKQIIIKQQQAQPKLMINSAGKLVSTNQAVSVPSGKHIIIGGQRILLSPGQNLISQPVQQTLEKTAIVVSNAASQQVVEEKPMQTMSIAKPVVAEQTIATPNTTRTQIIVQNQSLAQQISSGKVQIATVNGQQVLIRQTGNNQAIIVAHIKQQPEGPAQVVPLQHAVQSVPAVQSPPPVMQKPPQPTPPPPPTAVTSSGDLTPAMEQMLLKNQPPGTVIKCVTAQVIQTQQGPRIVLQGLHGQDFTAQQSALVQQQVKQQLLKAQESNGKHGVLGPTKIYLAIQPTPNLAPPPLAPVHTTTIQNASESSESQVLPGDQDDQKNESFVLTRDYIQQTIKSALKQENLNPEIEEKLLSLQKYQEMQMRKEVSPPRINSPSDDSEEAGGRSASRKRTYRHPDDEEWVDTPRKKVMKTSIHSERKVVKPPVSVAPPKPAKVLPKQMHIPCKAKDEKEFDSEVIDQKRVQNRQNKLNIQLAKHKELLRKEMHRKRQVLERDLLIEIQKDLTLEMAYRTTQSKNEDGEVKGGFGTKKKASMQERLKQEMDTKSKKSIKKSSTKSYSKSGKKKEKLYCICNTPYDDSKFYVGCDLCSNWFHGECVGITEESSRDLEEFICKPCKTARDSQELYCLCKQPYDESQFYICCDKCQDWFHGNCVGIQPHEAEFIDEYICPSCQQNNSTNLINTKQLFDAEYVELEKMIHDIEVYPSAWPFIEPVDPNEAPDYYKVIKDPMDLRKVKEKIESHFYNSLQEFISDMTKIFDNCRYYNPKNSQFYTCAENLENYFVQKIKQFRDNVLGKS